MIKFLEAWVWSFIWSGFLRFQRWSLRL